MRVLGVGRRAPLRQSLQRELANRLQHGEASGGAGTFVPPEQVVVDQGCEECKRRRGDAALRGRPAGLRGEGEKERSDPPPPPSSPYGLRRFHREPIGTDRQPLEDRLLLSGEQLVAPLNGAAHRP